MNVVAIHQAPPAQRVLGTVFSEAVLDRLTTMNAAIRALRGMGYKIVGTSLDMGNPRPIIMIERDREQSMAPLLDVAGTRWWRPSTKGKDGFAHFHNVTVTWRDA